MLFPQIHGFTSVLPFAWNDFLFLCPLQLIFDSVKYPSQIPSAKENQSHVAQVCLYAILWIAPCHMLIPLAPCHMLIIKIINLQK